MNTVCVELEIVNQGKWTIINSYHVWASFQYVISLISWDIDYLFDAVESTRINDWTDSILIGYFRVCWGDDLILLKGFVLIVGFIDSSDIFDDILCELGPLKMAISVDIDGLEELDKIANEVVLADLVFWCV